VSRFDFSWHDPEYHQETLENLKVAIKSTKKLCAVSFLPSLLFLVVAFVTLVLVSGGFSFSFFSPLIVGLLWLKE